MLDPEPNFDSYSLSQLLDAQAHLDRERYPARATKLDRLVAERNASPHVEEAPGEPSRHPLICFLLYQPNASLDRALSLLTPLGLLLALIALQLRLITDSPITSLAILVAGLPAVLLGLRDLNRKRSSGELPFFASMGFRALGAGFFLSAFGLVMLLIQLFRWIRS